MRTVGKITVFHQGALGDFILACPIFDALAGLTAAGRVLLWTRCQHAELVSAEPFFGGFFPHDDPSLLPFFDDELWENAPIPAPCLDSDLIIFLGGRSLKAVSDRLRKRLSALGKTCVWSPSFPEHDEIEMPVPVFIAKNLSRELSCSIAIKPYNIAISEEALYKAREILGHAESPVFIHPGSGGIKKIWPLSRWMGLVEWLRITFPSIPIVIVTGPADEPVEPFVKWAIERHAVIRLHNISLPILAAALSMGRLYIGNDSGISHLAAASGVPVIVIFGPTNPAVWAPWNKNVFVLRRQWNEKDILLLPDKAGYIPPDQEIRDRIRECFSFKIQPCA